MCRHYVLALVPIIRFSCEVPGLFFNLLEMPLVHPQPVRARISSILGVDEACLRGDSMQIPRGIQRKGKKNVFFHLMAPLIRLFLLSLANPYNTHVKPFVSLCFVRKLVVYHVTKHAYEEIAYFVLFCHFVLFFLVFWALTKHAYEEITCKFQGAFKEKEKRTSFFI